MKIIVVGGGIIGASITYHLAARRAGVTVLTGGKPGGVATADSFAWINAAPGNDSDYHNLRTQAILDWHRLQQEMGGRIEINWNGSIWWDKDRDAMVREASDHAAWGYPIHQISGAEIARREPNLGAPPEAAIYSAAEGSLSPVETTLTLLDAARELGASILDGTVTALLTDRQRITGIETEKAIHSADMVVLAAGINCEELATGIGVSIPMANLPGFLAQSASMPPLLNGLVLSPKLHMRQNSDGRIIVGEDFGGGPPPEDQDTMADTLLASACDLIDGVDELPTERHSLGMRPIPLDGRPIIGPAKDMSGLYVSVMHSGVTLAALVGRLVAEEIVSGNIVELLAPYRLERFTAA